MRPNVLEWSEDPIISAAKSRAPAIERVAEKQAAEGRPLSPLPGGSPALLDFDFAFDFVGRVDDRTGVAFDD
jgi:hypothetical protein